MNHHSEIHKAKIAATMKAKGIVPKSIGWNKGKRCPQCKNAGSIKSGQLVGSANPMKRPSVVAKNRRIVKQTMNQPEQIQSNRERSLRLGLRPPKHIMVGAENPNFVDGYANERARSKRQRNLGYKPLNEPFDGSVGHHIDRIRVINIPEELHKSISHSVLRNENMEVINQLAWDFMEMNIL